jgi:hypothetical protein
MHLRERPTQRGLHEARILPDLFQLGSQVALGTRRPAQQAFRLGQIVFLFALITGDENGVESAMANLDRFEGTQVGAGKVLLVGPV